MKASLQDWSPLTPNLRIQPGNQMISMSLPVFTILLLAQLGLLSAIVLILHRLSPRYGLTPLLLFIGTLTAALQFRTLGYAHLQAGNLDLTLSQGSFVLLPVILFSLLILYIINGTQQARTAMAGVLLLGAIFALLRLLPDAQVLLKGGQLTTERPITQSAGGMLASAFTLGIDLIVMIVVYQVICNLRNRYPSRTAALLALMAAIWTDALLYPLLSSFSLPQLSTLLVFHLTGKTLAVLALWPFLSIYLWYIAPLFPATSATTPRPTLDLFTTTVHLEARARFHHSLLRTITQINQLIIRTADPHSLVDEACRLLISNRLYTLVWIGLVQSSLDQFPSPIHPVTSAGRERSFLDEIQIQSVASPDGFNPANQAARSGQAVLERDIATHAEHVPWRSIALKHGLRASVALPMRQAGQTLGVLNVYAANPNAFDRDEIDLLQELADDLAHALISLEARQQQAILHMAAETMQDGLFISNLDGQILYTNPAIAGLFSVEPHAYEGADIRQVFSPTEGGWSFEQLWDTLQKKGKADFDLEQSLPDRGPVNFSIRASLAQDAVAKPAYIIINVRDTSHQHQYERQLLTLNRFTTEFFQTRDVQVLLDQLFEACDALLLADASGFLPLDASYEAFTDQSTHNILPGAATHLGQLLEALTGSRTRLPDQPIAIPDTQNNSEYAGRLDFLAEEGVRALLLLPVVLKEHPIGALLIYYMRPRHFSQENIHLGLTLAYTLAISLENARLYQAEKGQREFAEALTQGAAALNSSLDFNEVLDAILEQAVAVIQCRSVNLMLIEGDRVRVVRHLDYTDPGEQRRMVTGKQYPLSLPTLQEMLSSAKPLVIPDTPRDVRWQQLEQTSWINSYAATPLMVQGRIIGFLNMNSDQAGFFTSAITPRLQAFANTAAIAIQNARLYESTQQYAVDLEHRVYDRTRELRDAKERIEHILLSVPDAIYVLDEGNQLVQANPAGEALVVRANEQGIDIFSPDFVQTLARQSTPAEKTVLPIGEHAYQALASSLDVDGHQTGTVIVFRDVTRFRELDEMKTQFVSDVSHELRTPLTNLALYLDLLSKVDDPARSQRYLATLKREMQRLTSLIEDLLTISRLEGGRIEFHIEPVDVNRIVAELALDRMQMAANQDIDLTYTIQPDLPPARADKRLLIQVLSNLLTNALSYTPPQKTVYLRTSLETEEDMRWVKISVRDTGLGIPPEEMDFLFTRFFRGSASQITGAPGTGLGLSISKEIIQRLDGRISVESQPNKGSTFTVWLRAVL